jgi:pimeloyl-ACP methyl ester carboxylesterase
MPASHRLIRVSAVALAGLLLFSNHSRVSAAGWKDPSSHIVRFIEVEPGVKLEVLDWGGSGESVLLLSGHGDTGHIFDDFAPQLAQGFHVYAITRRGFGASSEPKQGYDLSRMVEDIKQVTDALKLRRVNLVGHSIAGDEMTRFALTYPERVAKLVYLEAAYDRVEAQLLEARFPKLPPSAPKIKESETPESIRASVAESEILMPEAAIRSTRVFGADGQFVRPVTPDWIVHAVAIMVEHPDYKSIHAPILAIYAVYETPAQLLPRYNMADRETRQGLDQVFDLWQPFARSQRKLLRDSAPGARIDEIHGASHYIFISHKDRVLRETAAFLRTH